MQYLGAVIFTLALWWFSTVAILYLDRRSVHTFPWSMAGGTALLVVALWAISGPGSEATIAGAYIGFAAGIAVWGWQLLSFYLGFITGPRRHACEPGLRGWARFREGARTGLYHDLVVLAFGALLVLMTWSQQGKIALWTYLVLYWMHQSAKLNLFFGALNHGEALLPADLRFLASFMKRRPMNLLFPFSVTISTIVAVLLVQAAASPLATGYDAAAYTMLACLMALAVLEHWLLVIPLRVDALWQWGVPAAVQETAETAAAGASTAGGNRTMPCAALAADEIRAANAIDFDSDYDDPLPQKARTAAAPPEHIHGLKASPQEKISRLRFRETDLQPFARARPSDVY